MSDQPTHAPGTEKRKRTRCMDGNEPSDARDVSSRSPRNRSEAHTDLVNAILLALGSRTDMRVWKNHTGAVRRPGYFMRYGLVGSSDILGITNRGTFIAIEVKTGNASLSKEQCDFRDMILRFNGIHVVARSLSDVSDIVGTKTIQEKIKALELAFRDLGCPVTALPVGYVGSTGFCIGDGCRIICDRSGGVGIMSVRMQTAEHITEASWFVV